MSSQRWQQLKARFFCLPIKSKSDENFAIDLDQRKHTEEKIKKLRESFANTKKYLQELNMPYVLLVKDETLIDTISDEFSHITKKTYNAYHLFLTHIISATQEYHSLLEKLTAIIQVKKQLKHSPDNAEFLKTLKTQQDELLTHHKKCAEASTKLVNATLQLPGKTSARTLLAGAGFSLAGMIAIGISVAMFIAVPPLMPVAALIAIAAVCVGLIIAGCVIAAKGKQQGFSKETYEMCRNAERQANSMVFSALR